MNVIVSCFLRFYANSRSKYMYKNLKTYINYDTKKFKIIFKKCDIYYTKSPILNIS